MYEKVCPIQKPESEGGGVERHRKKKKNPLHSDYETLDANKKHSLG